MTTRNLVSVHVPISALAEYVMRGAWAWDDAPVCFPEDARYVRAWMDAETDALVIVLEHPTFPRTPEGAHIVRVRVIAGEPVPMIRG